MTFDDNDMDAKLHAYRQQLPPIAPAKKDPALLIDAATAEMNECLAWAAKTLKNAGVPELELWSLNWLRNPVTRARGWGVGGFILTTSGTAHAVAESLGNHRPKPTPGKTELRYRLSMGPFRQIGVFQTVQFYMDDDGAVRVSVEGSPSLRDYLVKEVARVINDMA
jgi:hypothetical protein